MKHLLPILLLVFSVGVGAFNEVQLQKFKITNQCTGCDLTLANLSGLDMSGADLSQANLTEADLSGANLSNANLSNANLSKANLTGANLAGVDATNAVMRYTNIDKALFCHTKLPWSVENDGCEEIEQREKEQREKEQREKEKKLQIKKNAYLAFAKITSEIRERIATNWSYQGVDPREATVNIKVTRDGNVMSVKVVESSGDNIFDRSVTNAVMMSSPLPFLSNEEYYEFISNFSLIFKR